MSTRQLDQKLTIFLFHTEISFFCTQLPQMGCHTAHIFINRKGVVIQDNNNRFSTDRRVI